MDEHHHAPQAVLLERGRHAAPQPQVQVPVRPQAALERPGGQRAAPRVQAGVGEGPDVHGQEARAGQVALGVGARQAGDPGRGAQQLVRLRGATRRDCRSAPGESAAGHLPVATAQLAQRHGGQPSPWLPRELLRRAEPRAGWKLRRGAPHVRGHAPSTWPAGTAPWAWPARAGRGPRATPAAPAARPPPYGTARRGVAWRAAESGCRATGSAQQESSCPRPRCTQARAKGAMNPRG